MKKTLFSLTLMALAAIPSFAQSKVACPAEGKCKQEQVCNKGDRKCCRKDSCAKVCDRAKMQEVLFDGIQLTDAQKAKVEALNAKTMKAREEARATAEKAKADAKKAAKEMTADQRKEAKKAGEAARKEAGKARQEAVKAGKAAYLAEMKTILTADQYVKYLENAYTADMGGHGPKTLKFNGKNHGPKGGHDRDAVKRHKDYKGNGNGDKAGKKGRR